MFSGQKNSQQKECFMNQNPNILLKSCRSESVGLDCQVEININGIKVLFPFQPYEC